VPDNLRDQNMLAWNLVHFPQPWARDPARALELARRATEKEPQNGYYWQTRGLAHYRAGDAQAAVAALEKSMQLRKGGDAFGWLALALAHHRLGDTAEARRCYGQAARWMEKHKPADTNLLNQFKAEAESVLGLADRPPPAGAGPPP